jgi:hypothetical protein
MPPEKPRRGGVRRGGCQNMALVLRVFESSAVKLWLSSPFRSVGANIHWRSQEKRK